jgi:hypothetical protein
MAKLKKAPGRIIGRWKQEAIAANPGAPDEDLAKIVNEMARLQGYDYTITPEKVRTTTKKGRKLTRKPAPAPASAARNTPAQGQPKGKVSKMELVRQALQKLGNDAKPLAIREHIQDSHGVEISVDVASNYKGLILRKRAGRGAGPGGPSRLTQRPAAPAPVVSAAVVAGGISLDDIRAVKGLVDRIGAGKVQELAGVLAK